MTQPGPVKISRRIVRTQIEDRAGDVLKVEDQSLGRTHTFTAPVVHALLIQEATHGNGVWTGFPEFADGTGQAPGPIVHVVRGDLLLVRGAGAHAQFRMAAAHDPAGTAPPMFAAGAGHASGFFGKVVDSDGPVASGTGACAPFWVAAVADEW